MVMALVIETLPKPPGSRQLISPPAAAFVIVPAKVLHGAVRLHGLASSPTPDTHVRDACAFAGMENIAIPMAKTNATKTELFITLPWCYFDRQTDAKLARKSPNLRDSYHTLARAIAGRERPNTFAK